MYAYEILQAGRFRAHVAHIRQSRPDSGLGLSNFQPKACNPFWFLPFLLGSGWAFCRVLQKDVFVRARDPRWLAGWATVGRRLGATPHLLHPDSVAASGTAIVPDSLKFS